MQQKRSYGAFLACLSHIIFGLMPIYWNFIKHASSYEILAQRIIWSVFFLGIAVLIFRTTRQDVKAAFHNKKLMLTLLIGSVCIFLNWGFYYYALQNNLVLDSSMGYYIGPLIQIPIGIFILKEKFNKGTIIAFGMAIAALIFLTVSRKIFPLFALAIGLSFSGYSVAKKNVKINPFASLFLEALFMLPICLTYAAILEANGMAVFGHNISDTVFMIFSGIVTAIPIFIFSLAAQRTSLIVLGFAQYLGPTVIFLLGLFLYGEKVDTTQLVTFIIVWAALIVYTVSSYLQSVHQKKREAITASAPISDISTQDRG